MEYGIANWPEATFQHYRAKKHPLYKQKQVTLLRLPVPSKLL